MNGYWRMSHTRILEHTYITTQSRTRDFIGVRDSALQ